MDLGLGGEREETWEASLKILNSPLGHLPPDPDLNTSAYSPEERSRPLRRQLRVAPQISVALHDTWKIRFGPPAKKFGNHCTTKYVSAGSTNTIGYAVSADAVCICRPRQAQADERWAKQADERAAAVGFAPPKNE